MTTDFIIAYLISTHICLFFDMSPLQKRPACKLNYVIASLVATIPPMVFSYFTDSSSSVEHLSLLATITLLSSILSIATIQKVLDYDIDF